MPLKIHVTISPSLPAKVQKKPHEDNSPVQIFLFLIAGFSFFYNSCSDCFVELSLAAPRILSTSCSGISRMAQICSMLMPFECIFLTISARPSSRPSSRPIRLFASSIPFKRFSSSISSWYLACLSFENAEISQASKSLLYTSA